ncbi:MAG: aminopeptidase [Deltaproteobacteria bacterium]|nr:aminopeptidase [Deltaproteobacteria bacterium]
MSIEKAVENMILCAGLTKTDRVVVVGDDSIVRAAEELQRRGSAIVAKSVLFNLDRFGARPLPALPAEIKTALDDCDVLFVLVRAAADDKVNELKTVRRPLALHNDHIKHINMPGLTYEVLESAMQDDPRDMWAFTQRVFDAMQGAKEIVVRGKNGTDARFRFAPDIRWVNSGGDYRTKFQAKGSNNLPGAEVYTAPAEADGVFVVDGVLGDHLAHRYGVITATPVTLELRGGRIVKVSAARPEMQKDVEEYIRTDENANRIGEFAIGTNRSLKKLLGNMLHDEKYPSVHIAAGSPYPHVTGADWESDAHMDFITLEPTIDVDGRRVMEAGKHLL